jgi:hypothetical protein
VIVSGTVAGIVAALLAVRCEASGFFDADQDAVRADIEYLVNAGVLHIPVSTWPMPIDEVHDAVATVDDAALSAGESSAVSRLKLVLDRYDTPDDDAVSAAVSVHPTRFRQNEPLPREDASIGITAGRDYGRFTVHLAASANSRGPKDSVPVDRQRFRIDGSYASMQTGNWLWSVGEMARSWGPSQHDSLILSTNARPIPSVGLDRLSSRAPQSRWLRWVGPWRLSGFLGSLEHDRDDVRDPLFVGARFTFKPLHNLEVGLTRTSQVCGRGRQCNLKTFKNWLFGNTNTGTSAGITTATDPGNDMAGADVRWTSPIGHLPYAVYAQMIGEDQQGGVPFKYLGEFGADMWKAFDSGNVLHVNLEYSNTACSFTRKDPIYGCAYRHYIFSRDGYRYKDRIIGSTWEGDSEVTTLNLRWVKRSGDEWQLHARHGQLNRGGSANNYDVAAPTKRNLDGVDIEYRYSSKEWGDFRTGVGIDRLKDPLAGKSADTGRWYLIWRHRI